ncbi:MAG: hypothetical protein J6X94_07405 [Lachnospiraceae bacterium]|nr:hypothetical protein [Lachnospiraceae bacterium]
MKQTDGYLSVEAAMIMSFVFMIILLVIRLWFFRYDSVLQEMDTASVVIRTLEQQDMDASEKAGYALSAMQGRYKDHYISWIFGDISVSCTADSVECTVSGKCGGMPGGLIFAQLEETWSSSVTRSRRAVSEVFVIRTFRKIMEAGNNLSEK